MQSSNVISMKQKQYKTKKLKTQEVLEDGYEKAKKTRQRQQERKNKRDLWEAI